MTKLTAKKVENATPRSKEYKLHDGEGLFLRIRPSGAKSWLFSFSLPGDRRLIRMTLGSVNNISLKKARGMLPTLHKLIADGIDPRDARHAIKPHQHTLTALLKKKIKLIPASLDEYPIIQNMGRFYVYDMSEYLGKEPGWEMPEDGLYECIDFKKYWQTEHNYPFLIRYENELAGFVIVDKKGSTPDVDFNMAQFFILRKFKNKGIGQYVAQECFKKFPGTWEVMVIPNNTGALHFWQKTIRHYAGKHFEKNQRKVAHLNNSQKIIFRFFSECLNKP